MDLLTNYGTDTKLEEEGAWCEFRNGVEMKIRSSQSKELKSARARIAERNKKYFKTGSEIPDAVATKNEVETACAAVADWRQRSKFAATETASEREIVKTTILFSGEEISCTDENKKRVFGDPRLWELRQQVIGNMASADVFRAQEDAGDAKNSATALPPV